MRPAGGSEPRRRFRAILLLLVLPALVQAPALTGLLSANPVFKAAWLHVGPVRQILPGSGWVDDNAGVTTQALGHRAAEEWLHGRVPWWNEDAGLGMPLAAEMQNSALFLPFVLLLHFGNGLSWLKLCLQVMTGLFTLALLRQLRLGWRGAVVGAVLAEFCGTLAWFSHGPMIPVPFLPLLLLGIERTRLQDRGVGHGGIAIVAFAIAGSIVAGFPETAFVNGLMAGLVAIWRILQGRNRWWVPAARIAGGALLGLAISMPAWLPFLESLPISFLGQNDGAGNGSLLGGSYAMLLFPYLFGPLLYGYEKVPAGVQLWWHTGGYCDLVVATGAVLSLLGHRTGRDRGLRIVLLFWVISSGLKAAGLPPATWLFELVPGIRETVFHLYASPGWEFALILLTAFALDDLGRGTGPSARRALAAAALCGTASLAAVAAAWPSMAVLARAYRAYLVYPAISVVAGLVAACVLAMLLARREPVRAGRAASILLVCNAVALFGVPILSGERNAAADFGPVRFLEPRLGLQRFFSAILFAPNYGSYFGLASLNWNALPVPRVLTDRIGRDLDPDMDMTGLFGWTLFRIASGLPDPAHEQITAETALSRLQALGVAFLVVPHGFDPLRSEINLPAVPGPQQAEPLTEGTRIAGNLPAELTGPARIDTVGVRLGTYGGHPDGTLSVRLCAGDRCVAGHGGLRDAPDNGILSVPLDQPLETGRKDMVSFTLSVSGLRGAAALYTVPVAGGGRAPFLQLRMRSQTAAPGRVYADGLIDVLKLPDPAPYFSTVAGRCRLEPVSRSRLVADCPAPDTLVRRELFYPGWRALVNGDAVQPFAVQQTFQGLSLPAGRTTILFRYAPPHILWGWSASLAGLCMAVTLMIGGRGRRFRVVLDTVMRAPARARDAMISRRRLTGWPQ